MTSHSSEYLKHMNSRAWRDFKKTAIVAAGRKCQACGAANRVLQVHHKHYRSLGAETLADVSVLCVECHKKADRLREKETETNAYHRAVDSFAKKRHGEDWELTVSSLDVVYQDYDDWAERKDF